MIVSIKSKHLVYQIKAMLMVVAGYEHRPLRGSGTNMGLFNPHSVFLKTVCSYGLYIYLPVQVLYGLSES